MKLDMTTIDVETLFSALNNFEESETAWLAAAEEDSCTRRFRKRTIGDIHRLRDKVKAQAKKAKVNT